MGFLVGWPRFFLDLSFGNINLTRDVKFFSVIASPTLFLEGRAKQSRIIYGEIASSVA